MRVAHRLEEAVRDIEMPILESYGNRTGGRVCIVVGRASPSGVAEKTRTGVSWIEESTRGKPRDMLRGYLVVAVNGRERHHAHQIEGYTTHRGGIVRPEHELGHLHAGAPANDPTCPPLTARFRD